MIKVIVLFALYNVLKSEGANILGIISMPSYSHQVVFQPLWRELSLRGHQVTVLTTNPVKDPALTNLTEIDLSSSYKIMDNNLEEIVKNQGDLRKQIDLAAVSVFTVVDHQLSHLEVQKLIKNESRHFDLLMVESVIAPMIAFSERFKCPFIGVLSADAPNPFYELMGNPAHPVLNPDFNLPFVGKLNFIERLTSVLSSIFLKEILKSYGQYNQMLVKKHFGETFPSVTDIEKNMSMLFLNAEPIFYPMRPLVPAVVHIGGGIHRHSSKPLPVELQKYLDNASGGFIYFSLGSSVKGKFLEEKTRNIILETFSELPYKVLWKFELEKLPGKPENVMISKWFPQQDVFKHPNIKLFITQGGLQSIEEAIYDHVPMLGLPFFMDQPNNINRMVHNGLGLSLDHKTLDKETFKKTILEVINNPKYRNRIKELAALALDQPMTGLEKAVWWTEYVIRHKGARHLRSPMLDIPAYQYYLLDVIGFCILVVSIVAFLMFKLIKLLVSLVGYSISKIRGKTEKPKNKKE